VAAKQGPASAVTLLYSDESILVCVKPSGLDSQYGLPALLRTQSGGDVFCVHRLDRDAAGVMVYARNEQAAAALSREIAQGRFRKEYLAVCEGRPGDDAGTLRDLLFHDVKKNKSYVVTRPRRGVREAVLDYTLLESSDTGSLLRILLHTGRTHQIRVQFASRSHPLLGDRRYGSTVSCPLALWSCAISFSHPRSGKEMAFYLAPPEDAPWTDYMKGVPDHA